MDDLTHPEHERDENRCALVCTEAVVDLVDAGSGLGQAPPERVDGERS